MAIPVVTIIGKSKAGKTTLMEKMIGELKARGYRIGTLKHHSHAGFDVDKPGKDSWRHARAGSEHVIIAAPDKIASYRLLAEEMSFDQILKEFSAVDLILVEGYKSAHQPSLEVVREEIGLTLISDPDQRLAIAADVDLEVDVPVFDLNDVDSLADLVESTYLENK
ncbi:MAG: molybdopterin-guanine dinucleotide biosynthesis protein B [Anaerolineales bacterium]|nr:molybdopterin-guanine dinucleotide biosynthesis protein B [Anaerolineales bacterium]